MRKALLSLQAVLLSFVLVQTLAIAQENFPRTASGKPDFSGKTVFISGGSSGIAEEMAKKFVKLGAEKVIIAARRKNELERVQKECGG